VSAPDLYIVKYKMVIHMPKSKSINWLIPAIIIIVILAVLYFTMWQPKPSEEKVIKIGAVYPLTGHLSIYGETEKTVTDYAIDEINRRGGVNGRKIRVIYEDGKCSGIAALTAAKKLLTVDKVKIILGGSCSSEVLSMAPEAKKYGALLFTSIASSPDISKMGNVFRNTIITSDEGKKLADFINKSGYNRIAILTENNDYTLSIRDGLVSGLDKNKIVYDELFNFGEKDFRTYITKMKYSYPDAIFVFSVGGNGGLAVKQIREQNINSLILGAENPGTSDFLELAGDSANGIIYTDVPEINENNEKLRDILKYFSNKGVTPVNNYFVAARYDSIYILVDAMKKCGEDTECISSYIKSKEHYGLIGKYTFDKNGDMKGLEITLKKIVEGKPQLIKEQK
jgi:branched-chain amino acid transport system substrate-binding protein